GGQFDLERSSPLVAHGTAISTTPVSNIQRRLEEAKAEVAQFAAAQQAIDSLYEDEGMRSRPNRFPTDGAFTPAPSRRSGAQETAGEPESGVVVAPPPHAAEHAPGYAAGALSDRRQDDSMPSVAARRSAARPIGSAPRASRLPWMIAIVAVVSAGA